MDYFVVKHAHMGLAALSGSLFMLRGIWSLASLPGVRSRWARAVPHLIDTLLLLAAIVLAVWSAQYPLQQGWLTAKVVGLLIYIALGSIALRGTRSLRVRVLAFIAAMCTFGYIVAVAVTRNPLVVF